MLSSNEKVDGLVMPIYIDNRGDGEKDIAAILQKKNYPVVVQHIESGDYVFDEVGIERKTVTDLLNTLMSKEKGHDLWTQIQTLKDTYKKPAVLIEGFIDWHDRQVSGVLLGITNGYGIPYYNSLNHEQSADIIGRVWERYGVARTAHQPPAAVKRGFTPKQIQWCMLQTIPHIGGVMASKILELNPYIFTDTSHVYNFNIKGFNKDSKDLLLRVLHQ